MMTPDDADRIIRNPGMFGQSDLDEATHQRIANMRADHERDNRGFRMFGHVLILCALAILVAAALWIAGLGIEKAAFDAVQSRELAALVKGGW
jgi:hypothetical protein